MKPGTKVRITGPRIERGHGGGTVKAANDLTMTIAEANGGVLILRRDPASTTPMQWRWAGVPVEVVPDEDFRKRLRDLERRTRS